MDQLAQHIESIVFVSQSPISFKEIKGCLEETFEIKLKKPALEKAIIGLKEKYQEEHFSFEFVEIAGGFQFLTKPAFHNSVGTLLKQTNKRRLSKAALETLSIIAYKQPVPKSEMEKIRGVSCDYSVQKLLEKELVAIVGRSETPGRPLLYGTSEKFMDYFGLKSLEDMPKPKDFKDPDNEIGEQAPIEESVAAMPITENTSSTPPSANEAAENEAHTELSIEDTQPSASEDPQEISESNALASTTIVEKLNSAPPPIIEEPTKIDLNRETLSEATEDYEQFDIEKKDLIPSKTDDREPITIEKNEEITEKATNVDSLKTDIDDESDDSE